MDFLDSNVLVYLFDTEDTGKQEIAQRLVIEATTSQRGIISHQVVQETLNVITSRLRPPLSTDDLEDFLEQTLLPLWGTTPRRETYRRALQLRERYRLHFYDSLIVASALEAGCDRLLTEDLQDGQRIETLVIENPFRE